MKENKITKIIHISDLHFTGNFVVEWGNKLIEEINNVNPKIVVITGDLTDNGYYEEYVQAENFIKKIKCENIITVMGNHDARNGGYEIFEEIFKNRYPLYSDDKIIILGIDSTEPDIDDGHIGRANYSYIEEKMKNNNKLKIIALHHHLIPIPKTGRERHIPVDSGDFLKLIDDLKVDIVLSGHKHNQWIWKLNNTFFVTAGTAVSKKLKGKGFPGYNIIEFNDIEIKVKQINLLNGDTHIFVSNKNQKLSFNFES